MCVYLYIYPNLTQKGQFTKILVSSSYLQQMISSQPTFNHGLRGWVSVGNPDLVAKSRTVQYNCTLPLDLISSSGITIGGC